FDIGQAITVGISPEGIACGDLDQDGWLDLAVGNGVSQNISIMINTGDGEFVSKGEYTCGDGAEAVVIGNFNADALPDLAVALKRDNHYCILINEGGAVFNPPAEMTMPKGQNGLTTADFDNDGRDDIALAFRDNGIRLQMQAPDGSFLNPCYDFGTVKAARGICAADFDGDGPDIAMACHNNISILFNNFSNIPTPTPTPPNPCAETRVTISMPANMFTPGDVCSCTAVVCNAESTPLNGYPLFVILDVFGNLFFAPGFRQDFDNYLAMYPEWPTGETIVTVISSFNWPENTGYAQGVLWYGALTDPDVTTIVGEMGQFEFGWTP
ncbi:VCBS repeat-containing protein, partial [bacterium]|nr:VCBS repeat-containing protein [candidate division CSSED10-310 bacterium]